MGIHACLRSRILGVRLPSAASGLQQPHPQWRDASLFDNVNEVNMAHRAAGRQHGELAGVARGISVRRKVVNPPGLGPGNRPVESDRTDQVSPQLKPA